MSLEECRVAIRTFVTKLFSNAVLNMCCGSNCWTFEKSRVNFVKFTGVVSLTLKFAIIISLLQHRDIEGNLGPVYNIEKVVVVSFH